MAQQYQRPQGQSMQATGQTSAMQQGGAGGQQSGMEGGMQMGQQSGMQMGQQGMEMGMRLSDVETPQQRAAVDDISRAIQVCGWCADQCVGEADPAMTECIRLCEDVTELGEAALALVPRNSWYAESVLDAFLQAAQACARECAQHHHGHCQECAEVLGRATQSVQQYLGGTAQQPTM